MANDQDTFKETIANLPGVGEAKAQALWDAGFRTIQDVAEASIDELTDAEGIGQSLAEAILEGIEDLETPEEPEEDVDEGADEETREEPEADTEGFQAMTEEGFVDAISELPGVGAAKAQALWEAGYRSLDEVRATDADTLAGDVDGVGPKLAEAILQGIEDLEAPEPEPEVEIVEDEEAEEEEAEIVEEEAYIAKPKPELDDATQSALKLRNSMNGARPRFVRRNWWQFAKFDKNHAWRRPRGTHSKQREGRKHAPKRVKIGYRGPKEARDLHPSGFEEVLVHNPSMLDEIDPDTQAARIASAVGRRKRVQIIEKAQENGIHVLNPGGI